MGGDGDGGDGAGAGCGLGDGGDGPGIVPDVEFTNPDFSQDAFLSPVFGGAVPTLLVSKVHVAPP